MSVWCLASYPQLVSRVAAAAFRLSQQVVWSWDIYRKLNVTHIVSLEEALEEPRISQGSQAPPKVFKGSDFLYKSILALWKPIALALVPLSLVPLQNVPKPAYLSSCCVGPTSLRCPVCLSPLGTAFQVREQLVAWG